MLPFVQPGMTVLEIGSWLGKSTLWFAERVGPGGHVFAVDHFLGSPEHAREPEHRKLLPTLWDQFIANCWHAQNVISPVRSESPGALAKLHAEGARPDLVYVDGDHSYQAAFRDIMTAALLWPDATITGDDIDHSSVEDATSNVAFCLRRKVIRSPKRRCFALVARDNPQPARTS